MFSHINPTPLLPSFPRSAWERVLIYPLCLVKINNGIEVEQLKQYPFSFKNLPVFTLDYIC